MRIEEFNKLNVAEAETQMLQVCHSKRWAAAMTAGRPYADLQELSYAARRHWGTMQESDWLESMGGHARIGDMQRLRDKYSRSYAEQGQITQADDRVLQALLDGNQAYEAKHGFIFIVCATGKSAEEMLALLQQRLPNSRTDELINAAAEQAKITAIRLQAMFASEVTHA